MAKEKTKKIYTSKVADGRITVSINEIQTCADGKKRWLSASAPYPMYVHETDEKGNRVIRRLSKAQTEKHLLCSLGFNA